MNISNLFKNLTHLFLFLLVLASPAQAQDVSYALIPQPVELSLKQGVMKLPLEFKYCIDKDLNTNGEEYFGQFVKSTLTDDKREANVVMEYSKKFDKEQYELQIHPKGVLIKGSASGVFYGVQTLKQLLAQNRVAGGYELPLLSVKDQPNYVYRGFMLDSSRHIQSVETIKKVLDFMAVLKLNKFHWHLTDDDGYRIESKKFPRLNLIASYINKMGSFEDGTELEVNGYYTQEQIKEILAFAKARHIQVIPELDVPGHSFALLHTYPEFRCPNMRDSNAMCGGNPQAMVFMEELMLEVAAIFETDIMHIGGDERKKDVWNNCPSCRAKMRALNLENEQELQNHYLNEIAKYLASHGIRTMAWAEHLEGGIPEGQITQAWRLPGEAMQALNAGHEMVASYHMFCYLDYPANKELKKIHPGWMPVLNAEKLYNYDFVPKEASPEQAKLVLGGESPLWTERITQDMIYDQIQKRIEAHAERSWTPLNQKDYQKFSQSYDMLEPWLRTFLPELKK